MSTNSCDLSAQPFLHDVEDEKDEIESSFDTRAVKKHRRGWLLPLIAHCTIFTIYSVAFLVAASMMKGDQKPPALAYSKCYSYGDNIQCKRDFNNYISTSTRCFEI